MPHNRRHDQSDDCKEPSRDARLMLDVYTNTVNRSNSCNSVIIAQTDMELICSKNNNISYGIGMTDDDEHGNISFSRNGQYFHIKSDGMYRLDFSATLIPYTDTPMYLEYLVVSSEGKSLTDENSRLSPLMKTRLPQRFGCGNIQVNTFTVLPLKAGHKLSTKINIQEDRVIILEGARLLITKLN